MQKSEIQPGVPYACRDSIRPVLLLSAQQIEIAHHNGARQYVLSNARVRRDRGIGYLALRGEIEALHEVDAAQILNKFLEWKPDLPSPRESLPEGVYHDFLYSLTNLVGPYHEVMDQRREEEEARHEREARWTREYNEAVDTLNQYLETKLDRTTYKLFRARRIELSTSQVAQLEAGIAERVRRAIVEQH